MVYLRIAKTVMASQQHTSTHYFICLRVPAFCRLAWHVLEARLTQDIACKYRTGLYISLLQEYLQIAADEWRAFPYCRCKCQPTGTGTGQLLWQYEKLFILAEEFTHFVIITCTRIYILPQFIQLHNSESRTHFRRFYI